MSARRRGFSLPELVVVLSLGILIVLALQQTLLVQRRYYGAQRTAVQRHEATRVAMAVLTAALREASLPRGDAVIPGPGQVRVRMPLGSGLVCGADATGQRIGLVLPEGRWASGAGDSVLVLGSGGWSAEGVIALEGPGPLLPCVPQGGTVVRLGRAVPGVVPGSAARAFRSHRLDVRADGGAHWLARHDGTRTDLLAGPLEGGQGFHVWYVDAGGAQTSDPARAARLGVRVVTRGGGGALTGSARLDTLELTLGGRNR